METMATDLRKCPKSSLRILQWNADGISPKANELRLRLKEDDYDICLIQETKLRAHQKTPRMEGYASIRQDRPAQNGGGGLLSYIKDTLIFERVQESSRNGTEASTFRVKLGKRKWATVCNIYCPPVRPHSSHRASLETDTLPATPDAIILGDFNAHNLLWDSSQPEDDRGETLLDWTIKHDLTIMNDGSHTRINTKARQRTDPSTSGSSSASVNPVSGSQDQPHGESSDGTSAPDVSICGSTWHRNFSWCTVEGIGSSDHWPIAVTITVAVSHGSVFKGRPKWRASGVDWEAFRSQTELNIEAISPVPDDICTMVAEFNKALIDAGHRCVGLVRPGKRTKTWVNPEVREALRKRNRLRHKLSTHRKEWMEACKEVQDLISQAKTNAWREVLDDASNVKDDSKMWRIIRGLNGSLETNSPNEAMSYKGHIITSNKRKADIFAEHYAGVSSLRMSKRDRDFNRSFKERLRVLRSDLNGSAGDEAPGVTAGGLYAGIPMSGETAVGLDSGVKTGDSPGCSSPAHRGHTPVAPDFTVRELKTAIGNMKLRGAPGPDNIPPSFLKNLGPRAMEMLLNIFNKSLGSSVVPQSWRDAIILPLLKSGKPAASVTSFRPISLTSCVVKLLERMLSERLYFMAERGGWFSKLQAGFRKGRGVEDQILRITQRITDGFHKSERSILTLLDFSKAYDTVWRERLLSSLIDRGVPNRYVLFLRNFLLNRQARVRFNGELSKSRKMSQGLPQGSVLAPILFLFYIDNLASLLPNDLTVSMYADDVSILSSKHDRLEAQAGAQEAVDIVYNWSRDWKLTLNGSKSEVSLFTLRTSDKGWTPNITIGGEKVRFEPHPRLLGVTLDRTLTFGKQVELVVAKATRKIGMLRAVANSTWGWRIPDLRKIYLSHGRSVLTFASSSWQPWLSATQINRLEVAQNRCLRVITTQARSSPVEALRAETQIPSIATSIDANCLRSFEKALRMGEDHPRRAAATDFARKRLKRKGFRRRAEELYSKHPQLDGYEREPIALSQIPPWERGLHSEVVFPSLHGVRGRGASLKEIQIAAMERTCEIGADFNIYTDGSATAGTVRGGAGVVITTGDPLEPNVELRIKRRGAPYTCSYEEELRALVLAVGWVEDNCRPDQRVAIFTDSQSLCRALNGPSSSLDRIRERINAVKPSLTIQWIPGHCDIPGNELADAAAKEACSEPGTCSVSFGSSCAQISLCIKDPPIAHERTRVVYEGYSRGRESSITNRSDQALLAKLRSGHYMGLRAYRHRIDGVTDPTCRRCGEEPEDLVHWLHCPATLVERRRHFGAEHEGLGVLTLFPKEAVALARKYFLGAP